MATIHIVFANGGHEGRALADEVRRCEGVELQIALRGGRRAFRVAGLTWTVERSFAWLGASRRLSRDYEFRVGASDRDVRGEDGASDHAPVWVALRIEEIRAGATQ